ncbi:MAG: tRNA1Val (adenine37-N6)-methyltransferase [Parvicellaceae bacterium]|jgi:tRNA1Val (adenine37-N6)-methyltransferase
MSDFEFKQFSISQSLSAMKVGTDGVLLGAWASANKHNRILDIGCGTGLISLMAAQRFPEAIIEAVEIEPSAAVEAQQNFNNSPWKDRIILHEKRIQDFASEQYFNLIISNPPFFENSLKSGEEAKDLARHTEQLAFTELIFAANNLLKEGGTFAVIIPADHSDKFIRLAKAQGLFCNKKCMVKPTPDKEPKRAMIAFSKFSVDLVEEELIIEIGGRHQYSDEYIKLTKEFYLKM